MYLKTQCNIGSKRAFPTGVLDRWHNCLLIYWRTSCLVPAWPSFVLFYWMIWPWPDDIIRPRWPSTIIVSERARNDAENLGKCLSCAKCRAQGKNFELNLMVKMETRHPVKGSFGSEFPAICNHCGIITAWSRKTWKFCEHFLRFFGKTTPYGKIFKILFRKFLSRHRSTLLCSNVVKFVWREIGEIVRYSPRSRKKNSLSLKLSLLCGLRSNSARASPSPHLAHSVPDFIQIGSLSGEL